MFNIFGFGLSICSRVLLPGTLGFLKKFADLVMFCSGVYSKEAKWMNK